MRGPSLDDRVTWLEAFEARQGERNSELLDAIRGIRSELKTFNETITTIAAQRAMEARAADRWKNATVGLLFSVALLLLGFVARIAWMVQTARAAGGG